MNAPFPRPAAPSRAAIIDEGARLMLAEPHRIVRAIVGRAFGPRFDDRPPADWLSDAIRIEASLTSLGRSGHWAFDHNRLTAVRQAIAALRAMVAIPHGL